MWEIAIVLSIIGTCFFLVYLSSTLKGDDKFIQPMKIFLVLTALFLMIINASVPTQILNAANQSSCQTYFNTSTSPATYIYYGCMENETKTYLMGHITSNMNILIYSVIFFMVIFTLYYVYTVLMQHREKKKMEKGEEND